LPTKTTAIKTFLTRYSKPDLAELYTEDMECQVNVAQDNGERIEGDYKGRMWHGWTDVAGNTWKSFRIPWGASSDNAHYEDSNLNFDLREHAEGIGLTGWDWRNKLSRWVAYDFDAIATHSGALTQEQLLKVQEEAQNIPWVTVRKSTSGKGLHLYVYLDPVPTENHTEHAALARSILGQMSALTGFNFNSHVDVCGGNMWVWHRKMEGTDGLEVIKQGDILINAPQNWRDHVKVISKKRRKTLPDFVQPTQAVTFEELTGQRNYIQLDDEHRALINYLDTIGASFWWDQDHHMLVAHTYDLAQAFKELTLQGLFKTVATGKDRGVDHNCFMFPLRKGGWCVRRYTPGVTEESTWDQDNSGWTRCYFNVAPDLRIAARSAGGLEDDKGNYVFKNIESAEQAALQLGVDLALPQGLAAFRDIILKYHKDGKRLVAEIEYKDTDPHHIEKWLLQIKHKKWQRVFNAITNTAVESDTDNYDEIIRHLVTPDQADSGWSIKSGDYWHTEPLTHARSALEAMSLKGSDIKAIIGNCVFKPWRIINRPFQNEYPGDRCWNRNAAQFVYTPNEPIGTYATWLSILEHIGSNLTPAIAADPWCQSNGLRTGADYLKCWIASLFQQPTEPLPYLFLYGPQASGKSILHEALELLMTRGYVRAESALISSSGHNGELEHAVLCVVEEIDLKHNKMAYNRIKDWSTSLKLPIHHKYITPYLVCNTTHWIQCANERGACPIFIGDTRITMLYVDELDAMIPKKELLARLKKEAPDFLGEILKLEIPRSNDRLNVPVIHTSDKDAAGESNDSSLDTFIREQCTYVPGAMVTIAEFYDAFQNWMEPADRPYWTKIKLGKEMPPQFPKGRGTDAQWRFGNIVIGNVDVDPATTANKLITVNQKLVPLVER